MAVRFGKVERRAVQILEIIKKNSPFITRIAAVILSVLKDVR